MYKKRDARAKLLFCQSKPIAFLPAFPLPSPSSFVKLPNDVDEDDNDDDDDDFY